MAVEIDFANDRISTSTYIFHQSINDKAFELLEGELAEQELRQLDFFSRIIQSDDDLDREFQLWKKRNQKYYFINIEPHGNRILQFLQNRGLAPSLWSIKKKKYLLNMLRSESHRELLISLLEDENSNP